MADANETVTTADQLTPRPINELPVYPALNTTSDLPLTTAVPAAAEPEAPSAAPEEPVDAAAAEPEAKPKRGRPIKADQEIAELREQNRLILEQLAALAASQSPAAATPKTEDQPEPAKLVRPKRADFDDPDEYDDAIYGYREALRDQKETVAAAGRQAKETEAQGAARQAKAIEDENKRIAEAWSAKVTEAKTRYEDFDEVALSNDTPISVPMAQAILNSEYGADIAYWLGENVEEAKRISTIANPVRQALEIGRIEAAFAGADDKPAPRRSAVVPPAAEPVVARPAPGPRPIRPVQPRSQPVEDAPSPQNSEDRIERMLKSAVKPRCARLGARSRPRMKTTLIEKYSLETGMLAVERWLLELSAPAYEEIKLLLSEAGHVHAFGRNGKIDMHGIAVVPRTEQANLKLIERE